MNKLKLYTHGSMINKINEIVDWINSCKKYDYDKLKEYNEKLIDEKLKLGSEYNALVKKLDYIDKLHYICREYKDCEGCVFVKPDERCEMRNKDPEWWPEMKPEIDKAYNSLNKSEDKSAPNEPECERIPEKGVNKVSANYVNRSNDEEIIDILRTVLDNGTGCSETFNENILIKLMQIRNTPIKNYKFDQNKVDQQYLIWVSNKVA